MLRREKAEAALSWSIGGVLLLLFIVGLYKIVAPFAEGLVWGAIMTFVTWPVYQWMQVKCRMRALYAALFLTVGTGIVLILAVVPMVAELGKELYSISKNADLGAWRGAEKYFSFPALDRAAQALHIDDATVLFVKSIGALSLSITGRATQLLLEMLANIGIMLFSSYFFFLYGSRLIDELRDVLTHFSTLNWLKIFELTGGTIRGVVYGALSTALAQSVLAGIGFYAAGAPLPVLLGFVTMLMSFVPFGAPVVYVPVSLYVMLGMGKWGAAAGLLLWGVLVVSTIDNILRPLFISQTMRLPLLLVVVGVVGGIFAFGLLGLFMGPVLVALAHAAWKEIVDSAVRNSIPHMSADAARAPADSPPIGGALR